MKSGTLNFEAMSLIELTQALIQCENDKEAKNYHSEEEYKQLRSRIHFIKVELEKRSRRK